MRFLTAKKVKCFVVFSQGHPYLDGFYIKIPHSRNGISEGKKIIEKIKKHHEVGAFSASHDAPMYDIVISERDELISEADQRGIRSYEFVLSNDILAGYQTLLQLLGM